MDIERPPNLRTPGSGPGSAAPPGGAGFGGSPPPINALAELDLSRLRAGLGRIGERRGRTAAQVALAWVLQGQAVAGAIVGVRTVQEAQELPGAADLRLDPAELEEIEGSIP